MKKLLIALTLVVSTIIITPATATPLTITVGLSPERQCALAKPFIRVPIPWRVECYRSAWDGGSWGQTIYTDWDMRYVDHIEVYLKDGISTQDSAFMIAHELAHGYVSAWSRGGPPDDDWVADHEAYMDHFARCVTTKSAPC